MSRTYWIKENSFCNLDEIEWIKLNGTEFYQFINSNEGKGRYFIDFDDMQIETDKAEYVKWRKEKDASDYLRDQNKKYSTMSLYSSETENGCNGESFIEDISIDIDDEIDRNDRRKIIIDALPSLSADERDLIDLIYYDWKSKTKISVDKMVTQQAISKKEKRIMNKLKTNIENSKNRVVKFPKSSQ